MRWLLAFATVLLLAGAGGIFYSETIPVYTDPEAPGRISSDLESFPRETRFKEWHARLHAFETPHKRVSDIGRGLFAAGIGLLSAVGLGILYHRIARIRGFGVVLLLWFGLWLGRIPFTAWYYGVRQRRFDYPAWGDSIAIPVFSESIAWVFGAVLSSVILRLLLIRHPLPPTIRVARPVSAYGWLRCAFIALWLAALAMCVVSGVSDGNEGMVLAPTVASVILLAFLSAIEAPCPNNPANTRNQSAANLAS